MSDAVDIRAGGATVRLSHPGKILFPEANVTKAELADYYLAVSEAMLPHLRGRPLALERYPDGVSGPRIFQKHVPPYFPGWVQRATIKKQGGTLTHDGRLYLDVMRNGYAQTAVVPYAVRAQSRATVATPLAWEELDDRSLRPDRFTVRTVPGRIANCQDPWAGIRLQTARLAEAGKRLRAIRSERMSPIGETVGRLRTRVS